MRDECLRDYKGRQAKSTATTSTNASYFNKDRKQGTGPGNTK